MNYFLCDLILNQKEGIKFYKNIIIKGEPMYGEQVFGRGGDMQNIAELKVLSRVMNH
jgi:hypothetical protein